MSRRWKRIVLMLLDAFVIQGALVSSYFFLSPLIEIEPRPFFVHLYLIVFTYIVLGYFNKVFDKINRFTSVKETLIHIVLVTLSYIIGSLIYVIFDSSISFRYITFAYLISVAIIPASRVVWRLWIDHQRKLQNSTNEHSIEPVRTLLIGAGDAGAIFVRSLRNRPDINVVGFLDDDINKQNTTLHGYSVIGMVSDLKETVEQYNIEQITITIPSLSNNEMKEIVTEARETNVKTNQMPYFEDILSGDAKIDEFKEIEITDLLGRDEVELDTESIREQVTGKIILISGAGGSIGSEIARQVAIFSPKKIILVGHGEFSVYKIERELRQLPNRTFDLEPVIADIQDRERIFEVLNEFKPEIVYHAAAHKHVPLMEKNPREAIKNNIFGTKNLAEASKTENVEAFVMISTDKAVNPPNVMGSTKRIAEMIVTGLNEFGKTKFVAVRFGNVLNSSGSVIPLFKEQIEKGGPVTVTDFRMTRYFMTIPEASRLVMQAGALADGGEIFVLDMGEPVKILDLAKQMIWLSGYNEHEIGIVESGIRPGEKLYEELLASDENINEQVFEKIFVGKVHNLPLNQVYTFIETLDGLSNKELKKKLVKFANNSYEENRTEFTQILNALVSNSIE